MKVSRNWLQFYFEDELPSVEEIDSLLAMRAFETEGIEHITDLPTGPDAVIDVDVLPNRAHDALSHWGIASELAGHLGRKTKGTNDRYYESKPMNRGSEKVLVKVETDDCRRYMAVRINNVNVGKSPDWLVAPLDAIGQRSINNVVDSTNFVMFDLGQPLHAFDADKVSGGITVRKAKPGESITTLTGEHVELDESITVIADDEKCLAIAGVKGGMAAEVTEDTKNLIVEVANFDPVATRKAAIKTGIRTDSSKRFENELSPTVADKAMLAIMRSINEICGNEDTVVGEITDIYPNPVEPWSVNVSVADVERILGINVGTKEISEILDRFKYEFKEDNGVFNVSIPARRLDLKIKEDLVEEIGRIYGYEKLDTSTPDSLDFKPSVNKNFYYHNLIRDILTDEGYSEIMTYTFTKKGDVETANPLASDKGALRKNLTKKFCEAMEANTKNKELFGVGDVLGFEIGKVFKSDDEEYHLAIGIGNKKKADQKEAQRIRKVLEEKLRTSIKAESTQSGNILVDEINLDDVIAGLEDPSEYNLRNSHYGDAGFSQFSHYPYIVRDIALWVDEDTTEQEIEKLIQGEAGELLVRVDLFDEYHPDGSDKKSYAFKMVFQSMDKTLTDSEIIPVMEGLEGAVKQKGWEVR